MRKISRQEFDKLVRWGYAGDGYVDDEGWYRTGGQPHVLAMDPETGGTILEPVEIEEA